MKLVERLFCTVWVAILGIHSSDSAILRGGIMITSAKRPSLNAALAMKNTHLFIVPVTPTAFVQNHTLIRKTISISNDRAPLTKFASCDFDYMSEIIYLYDRQTSNIIAINKFRAIVAFHKGLSRNLMVSIAVDWVSHNVYWTDPMFGWIAMQPGNPLVRGDQYKIIIDNLDGPRGLAVSPKHGYMFFSDLGATARIERATLRGTQRTVIVSQNVLHPVNIVVDVASNRIIWVDEQRDTIETADFNGLDRKIIRRQPHTAFFDVGVYKDILGVIDLADGKLKFFDKDSGDVVGKLIESRDNAFFGVGMYYPETQPQQLNPCLRKGCKDMCIGEGKEAHCLCREGFKLTADNITCTENRGAFHRAMVLGFQDKICLMDIRSIITNEHVAKTSCVPTSKHVMHMDIDSWERKVIYASNDGIYSGYIGGKVKRLAAVSGQVTGLSLDWTDKNIYWSIGGEKGSIMAFSQQTLTLTPVHQESLNHTRNVIVLPLKRKLMWISGSQGSFQILMSNIDGTDIEVILDSESLIFPVAIAVDSTENVLFWSDNGYIRRCNLDGTDITLMHLSMTGLPAFIEPYKGHFVFAPDHSNAILSTIMVNKPYSLQHRIATGSPIPLTGLKILDQTRQPYTANPCNVLNGGCEHICLFAENEMVCECNFGFELDFNGQTCSATPLADDFILVADWTHNEIYQVSMVSSNVSGIDVDGIDQPAAVAYNYKTQEVIWGETTTKTIKSAFIDGLNATTLLDTSLFGSHPDRFAIDFTSGNIYYTSVNKTDWGFAGVGVLTPSGKHKKLIVDGMSPRDIVVDPEAGLLFWTDHREDFPFVKRANMDGTEITTIVTANIKWPNGLAIDYIEKHLYLTDGLLNTIQRCDYEGQCEIIYNDTAAHMMDIDLMGDYLYFTAWNRPYIAKMHKTNISDFTKLIERAELGRLDSISVFSSKEMNNPVSQACLSNNGRGECSTFCLPTTRGFTCACEDGIKLLADHKTCENGTKSSRNPHIFLTTITPQTSTTGKTASIKSTNIMTSVTTEPQQTVTEVQPTSTGLTTGSSIKHTTRTPRKSNSATPTMILSTTKRKSKHESTTERVTIRSTPNGLITTGIHYTDKDKDKSDEIEATKETTLNNNSSPLKAVDKKNWIIPLVICFAVVLAIGLPVVALIVRRKRHNWRLQRTESRSSNQGLANPMYQNLLRDEL